MSLGGVLPSGAGPGTRCDSSIGGCPGNRYDGTGHGLFSLFRYFWTDLLRRKLAITSRQMKKLNVGKELRAPLKESRKKHLPALGEMKIF